MLLLHFVATQRHPRINCLLHVSRNRGGPRAIPKRPWQRTPARHVVLISIRNNWPASIEYKNSRVFWRRPREQRIQPSQSLHASGKVPTTTRDNESFYWVNFYTNCGCTFRRRDILQMILLFHESSCCLYLSGAHNGGASLVHSFLYNNNNNVDNCGGAKELRFTRVREGFGLRLRTCSNWQDLGSNELRSI